MPIFIFIVFVLIAGGSVGLNMFENQKRIKQEIIDESNRQGIDSNLTLSIAQEESGFASVYAADYDTTGSFGIFQITRNTASDYGLVPNIDFQPDKPDGEMKDIRTGVTIIKKLLSHYNGDMRKTIQAYNHGQGNIDRHSEKFPQATDQYLIRVSAFYDEWSNV